MARTRGRGGCACKVTFWHAFPPARAFMYWKGEEEEDKRKKQKREKEVLFVVVGLWSDIGKTPDPDLVSHVEIRFAFFHCSSSSSSFLSSSSSKCNTLSHCSFLFVLLTPGMPLSTRMRTRRTSRAPSSCGGGGRGASSNRRDGTGPGDWGG